MFQALKGTELHPLVRKIWHIMAVILFFLVLLLFLPWQQTVQGSGVLMALQPQQRDYTLVAPIDGYVQNYSVREGSEVKEGDALLEMVDLDEGYEQRLQAQGKTLQVRQENLHKRVATTQATYKELENEFNAALEVYKQKEQQILKRIEALEYKELALQKSYEIEHANYERVAPLYKEGIESKRVFEMLERTSMQAQSDLKKAQNDRAIEQENQRILKEEFAQYKAAYATRKIALDNQMLALQNELEGMGHTLQTAQTNLSRYEKKTIRAKSSGSVVRLLQNDTNRYIAKNTPLLHFAPAFDTRAIQLKVSDFNMPLLQEGLKVRIKFYGWPALQIKGWPAIKFGTFAGIVKQVEVLSHDKGYYYAYIVEDPNEPWPDAKLLRMGTQASAWVRLNTVPIWYEIWRLSNALPPQMVAHDEDIAKVRK
jgi:multidrug efflux pump subunit AcrA (membrane-fusion protein)